MFHGAVFCACAALARHPVFRLLRRIFSAFERLNRTAKYYTGGAVKMAADARVKITLRCEECKQRNYNTMKNKKNTSGKLEMRKYCPFCRKHTKHVETK